jgi:acetamidase/formamidase
MIAGSTSVLCQNVWPAGMSLAARNAIKFLAARAKISELDAYAMRSVAVSFRVTQVDHSPSRDCGDAPFITEASSDNI